MTTTTNFEFRTKFKKLLKEEDIPHITDLFQKFCLNMNAKAALDILWSLTYRPTTGKISKWAIWDMDLTSELVSAENIAATRNELRFQYEKLHPNFLEVDLPEEAQEAYHNLKKHADAIVAKVVYECLQPHLYIGNPNMQRTLYLLKSEKDNQYFGGIRALGFDMEEADYLKPYHNLIHDLLESLNNFISKTDESELPFYMSEQKIIPTEVIEQIHEDKVEDKALIPEEILKHKEIFKEFVENYDFNKLIPIGQIGFDLNEVISKKEEIYNFIKAVEALIG